MNDDDFARSLRARADALLPEIPVSTDRVVPRARRRRAVVRSTGTLALAAVLAGGGWAALGQVGPAPAPALPAVGGPSGTTSAEQEDAEAAAAAEAARAEAAAAADAAAQAAEEAWVGMRYWYTSTRSTYQGGVEERETWTSREHPGLIVVGGDLADPTAIGPQTIVGPFRIDGVEVEMLEDPGRLPTDVDALTELFRESSDPGRSPGSTVDEKVFSEVRDLLLQGGLNSRDLRLALVGVAQEVGGAATEGTDSLGRAGLVITRDVAGIPFRLVVDPASGLLLEDSDGEWSQVYLEQRARDDIPVEPTLEMTGCPSWNGC